MEMYTVVQAWNLACLSVDQSALLKTNYHTAEKIEWASTVVRLDQTHQNMQPQANPGSINTSRSIYVRIYVGHGNWRYHRPVLSS